MKLNYIILITAMLILSSIGVTAGNNHGGHNEGYFNLAVCYEGNIGQAATSAKFGYLANGLDPGVVQKNNVTNGGITPQGMPLGNNTVRVWSTNSYALNSHPYVWTLKIDGMLKMAIIDSLSGKHHTINADNKCPDIPIPHEPDVPEFSVLGLASVIGSIGLFIYARRK